MNHFHINELHFQQRDEYKGANADEHTECRGKMLLLTN